MMGEGGSTEFVCAGGKTEIRLTNYEHPASSSPNTALAPDPHRLQAKDTTVAQTPPSAHTPHTTLSFSTSSWKAAPFPTPNHS